MPTEATRPEGRTLPGELEEALGSLEAALQQAGHAVSSIRAVLPQIATLVGVVRELETAMARARQQFGASGEVTATTPQRLSGVLPVVPEAAAGAEAGEGGPPRARCLLLAVQTKEGSLDLKAVDSSVSEHNAVVDIALLDYDGRRATLKIWVDESADPLAVRTALLESLQRHFAGEQDVEISIDLEGELAA